MAGSKSFLQYSKHCLPLESPVSQDILRRKLCQPLNVRGPTSNDLDCGKLYSSKSHVAPLGLCSVSGSFHFSIPCDSLLMMSGASPLQICHKHLRMGSRRGRKSGPFVVSATGAGRSASSERDISESAVRQSTSLIATTSYDVDVIVHLTRSSTVRCIGPGDMKMFSDLTRQSFDISSRTAMYAHGRRASLGDIRGGA